MKYFTGGIAILITGLLVTACGTSPNSNAYKVAPPEVGSFTHLRAFEGQIQVIDTKNRRVTFLLNNGQTANVQIVADTVDWSSLKVDDHVEYGLGETDQLIIARDYVADTWDVTDYPVNSAKERDSYNAYFHNNVYASGMVEELERNMSHDSGK